MPIDVNRVYALMERGALAEAENICRGGLASNARDAAAWSTLGVVLRQQGRVSEAEAAYKRAIELAPRDLSTLHNYGALLSQLERAEEALAALDKARALGLGARELHINRGRALLQLYRLDEAEHAYVQAVALEPRDPAAQSSLAQLRYMRGDPDFARDIARAAIAHSGDVGLQLTHAVVLRRAGSLLAAENQLRKLLRAHPALPEPHAALGAVLHEMGRLKEAEAAALTAAISRPHDVAMIESLVEIELALERPDEALPFIRTQRQRQPHDQRWIAYEATAARVAGDSRYRELYDYSRFVRVYELEAPPGWSSVSELNEALARVLHARHRFAGHPLDQSLRHGSQTARSLLMERDGVIQGVLSAFVGPLEDYAQSLGSDAGHPLLARNRGSATLLGCWSVELRRHGYHVNHVHPQGWISSAYYVCVPGEAADTAAKSGWLKFGEPGMPIRGITAEHFVQPRAGRLVLFPSYMWHGTNAIEGDEPRLSVAFDAGPKERT